MVAQDRLGQAYDSEFFDDISDGSSESARVVLPLLRDLLKPASVLDVGCGLGAWLAEWVRLGVTDVLGLDGTYVDKKQLRIDPEKFIPTDLERPFSLDRRFDLVECLEVAEHLDPAYASQLIESLASHGDVILFSAAIPGQGGTHHVNEQWPSYWIEKFSRVGFRPYDVIRPRIWTNQEVKVWYRQNILVFSNARVFDTANGIFDVVHPELWDYAVDLDQRGREVLLHAPKALSAAIRGRLTALGRRPSSNDHQ